jgi:hypothetical protein
MNGLYRTLLLIGLVAFGSLVGEQNVSADQPIRSIRAQGTLDIDDDGFALARLTGTAPGMGKFVCYGEIVLQPDEQGSSLVGVGIAAFTAANGDYVTAYVECQVSEDGVAELLVHWRDAVTFSDGTEVATTGRFVKKRPPGPIYMKIDGIVRSPDAQ